MTAGAEGPGAESVPETAGSGSASGMATPETVVDVAVIGAGMGGGLAAAALGHAGLRVTLLESGPALPPVPPPAPGAGPWRRRVEHALRCGADPAAGRGFRLRLPARRTGGG